MITLLAQIPPEQVAETCNVERAADAGVVCRNLLRWTENETVARVGQWLADTPLALLLILIVAFVVNRLLRRALRRFMNRLSTQAAQETRARIRRLTPSALQTTSENQSLRTEARVATISGVLKNVVTMVVFAIATMLILDELGVNLAPLLAGAGIVGVALGFGAQSLVKDVLSGLFMLAEDQFGVGDVIDVGEAIGTVEAVSLRSTRVRSVEGTVWHVPNGEILRVGNMSQNWARALVDIDVAYDTELDRAIEVVKEVADGIWRDEVWTIDILEEPEVWGVQALAADGVTIRLVIKTLPGRQFVVTRELNRRIKARFDQVGIEIPFPQRVMWLRREEDDEDDDLGD